MLFGVKFEPENVAVPPSKRMLWLEGVSTSAFELPGHGFGVGLGVGFGVGIGLGGRVGVGDDPPTGREVGVLRGVLPGLGLAVGLLPGLGLTPGGGDAPGLT